MIVMNNSLPITNTSKKIQILVVEDEKIIAINLKESLESLGYIVPGIAVSGEQAIEKSIAFHPDLVLMDIRLKGEMDGIEAADCIWEQLQIPVIYVTGHSDQGTLERAKITAPFGYILKPVKDRELYVTIETALQRYEREQLLSAILKGMGDGVIVVDKKRRIKFLNQVAEKLTGWQLSLARDHQLPDVFNSVEERTRQPIDDPVAAVFERNSKVYVENHTLLICQDGTTTPIGYSAAPIRDNTGEIAGVVLVFRDMTQRRLAEERNHAMERARQLELQIVEIQRLNQLKDDLLSTVSHELRTPLSNIKMAVRLLETVLDQQGLLDPETISNAQSMTRYLNILQEQCNQELALVNDLLDMRAIEADANSIELTSIRLQDWIPQVIESFKARIETQQQCLQLDLSPDLPPLISDVGSLTRVLSELMHNACKYTPPGEQITVTAQTSSVEASSLSSLQISVSNSGVSIPPEELSRIFDPFYRIPKNDPWRQGGTGLGLALVRKLVNRLQGTIDVATRQNWITFTIRLPDLKPLLQEETNDCNE